MGVQTTEMLMQQALTESPEKAMVESPLKVLVGNQGHPYVGFDAMGLNIEPDFGDADDSLCVTELDFANARWKACKFDLVNNYGTAFDMFSGSPETTSVDLFDLQPASPVTRGWYAYLNAQAYPTYPDTVFYDTVYYWTEGNPPECYSGAGPGGQQGVRGANGLVLTSEPSPSPLYWAGLFAASGWQVYEMLYISRGMAYYTGPLISVPYFIGRLRVAAPVVIAGQGLNGSIFRVDMVEAGFKPATSGHLYMECPFTGGAIIPQPTPNRPFDSGGGLNAVANPLAHDALSAVLPVIQDMNFLVLADDPSSFASRRGFKYGVWASTDMSAPQSKISTDPTPISTDSRPIDS